MLIFLSVRSCAIRSKRFSFQRDHHQQQAPSQLPILCAWTGRGKVRVGEVDDGINYDPTASDNLRVQLVFGEERSAEGFESHFTDSRADGANVRPYSWLKLICLLRATVSALFHSVVHWREWWAATTERSRRLATPMFPLTLTNIRGPRLSLASRLMMRCPCAFWSERTRRLYFARRHRSAT
jgi:hypothetical protein